MRTDVLMRSRFAVLCACSLLLVALLAPAASVAEPEPATLVVSGARVWTGDPERPWAEAVASRGETIVAVGSAAELAPWIGEGTEVIAGNGGMLVPGLIDAHVHFLASGSGLASVQLRDAATPTEFAERIGAFAAGLEPGEWVLNGSWDHKNWGGELPSRQWIDALTPDNPVWVMRLDGHMGLANSRALALAGVNADTPEVEGGVIVRDAEGRPTGVLKDNAMGLVFAAVPEPGPAQQDRYLEAAMRYVAAQGVTSVHDVFHADFDLRGSLETYRRAERDGRLITRIYSLAPLSDWASVRDRVAAEGRGSDWVRIGGLKGFMDGSLGSHTAALLEPFDDAPGKRGMLINSLEDMRRWIGAADAAGLQVAVHAIGDRAIRDLLDIYREVARDNGPRDRRFRMEHAQHIHAADIVRFARQDVIASMQPYHAIDDGRWAERVIGTERSRTTYAFRSLIDSGAHLAFGSDWFVAPADPIAGIYAAVTRRTLDGANPEGWMPGQKITVEQALRSYTYEAAYASFEEDRKGTLKVGLLADMVLLDRDLGAIAAEAIGDARVMKTIVGGRVVYSR